MPANPAGWLVTTARRRGLDVLRAAGGRDATLQRHGAAVDRGLLLRDDEPEVGDDRLRPCSPARTRRSRSRPGSP